jgi:nucleoside-diphosphate-sugar epimerase
MEGKDTVFAINVDGTRNVVEVSQEYGVKAFVYTSSVTVLLDQLEENFRNADETWSVGRATTLYGQSKVCHVLLRAFRLHLQEVVPLIVRFKPLPKLSSYFTYIADNG